MINNNNCVFLSHTLFAYFNSNLYIFLFSLPFSMVQTNQKHTIQFVQLPQFPTFNPPNSPLYPNSAVFIQNDKGLESAFLYLPISTYYRILSPVLEPPRASQSYIYFLPSPDIEPQTQTHKNN